LRKGFFLRAWVKLAVRYVCATARKNSYLNTISEGEAMKSETRQKLITLYLEHIRPVRDDETSLTLGDHLRIARALRQYGCRVGLLARSLGVVNEFPDTLDIAVSEGLTDQEIAEVDVPDKLLRK
jgi:hypothetical protein